MDPSLDRRFPSTADIERAALRRMPKFIRDYVFCGMGLGGAVRRNREALDAVGLMPRYLVDAGKVAFGLELFGQPYDAPFGVAPVGMGDKGADHIMELFKDELRCVMGQLGCVTLAELSDRLMDRDECCVSDIWRAQ